MENNNKKDENIQKDQINFVEINRRSNDFSNLDELQKLDIADENFEQQKEAIIDAELIELGEICDELIKMKEKIDDEEKRLDTLKENLPKEIEDAIARENEIQQELNTLEEEFANLSEEDPQYEEKKTELEGKREELKEASSSLSSLKKQQENLKSEYEKLNDKKLEYKDAKEVYDNRTEISFDVIFKFEPEKAKQINDMETPEEIDTLDNQNEQTKDDDKQKTNINLTPEQFEELLSRINNQEQQVQAQEIQNDDIQNNVIESQENNEIAEEQTALTDPSKENKFKVFFRNFKEKVKNIVRKVTGRNISDTRAEEIASEEITQNDDFGDSLRSSVRNEEEIIQEQIQREANQIRNMDSQQIENILE